MSRHFNHPTDDLLMDYVADTISDGGRLRVDEHLSECSMCVTHIRALWTLRDNFDSIWTTASAEQHNNLQLQMSIARAAEIAEQSRDPKIKAWIKSLERGAKIGIKLLMDRGKQVTGIAAGALPGSFEFEHRPRVAGVGSPGAEARVDEQILQASHHLAHDNAELAMQNLVEASLINSYATQSVNSIIYRLGKKYAEIVADSKRGSLTVKHWPIDLGANAEFVLLIPRDVTTAPRLATLKAVAGEDYVVAIFDEIGDGANDVIIGPDS